MEAGRRHTHDGERAAVDPDGRSADVVAPREQSLPERMTDDGDGLGRAAVVTGREQTAPRGSYSEHLEEVAARDLSGYADGRRLGGDVRRQTSVRSRAGEHRSLA